MAENKGIFIFDDWFDILDDLKNNDAAYKVLHAVDDFSKTGVIREDEFSDVGTKVIYKMLVRQVSRNIEAREEKRQKCREAGQKGGEAKAKNAKQTIANAKNANECLADCSVSTYTEPKPKPESEFESEPEPKRKSSDKPSKANTEYITANADDVPHPDAKGIDALTAEQPIINYFYRRYKEHTGNEHPSVSLKKLIEIASALNSSEADESYVDEYFGDDNHRGLCGDSDCSIFHFASPTVQELLANRVLK